MSIYEPNNQKNEEDDSNPIKEFQKKVKFQENEENNLKKRYGRKSTKKENQDEDNDKENKENIEENDSGNSEIYASIRLSRKGIFTKGRLVTENNNDIIKIDNMDDDEEDEDENENEFENNENNKYSKTDDYIPIKESPSKKDFQLENNINRKKRRTLATSIVPEDRSSLNTRTSNFIRQISEIENEEDFPEEEENNNKMDNIDETNNDKTNSYDNSYDETNNKEEDKKEEIQNYIKNDEFNKLDDTINELEQYNAKNILKGDLYDLYNEVIKQNLHFKDDIFFVNLNYFENKVGDCDDTIISHSYRDYPKSEFFKGYIPSIDLLKKYEKKANKIINEDKI